MNASGVPTGKPLKECCDDVGVDILRQLELDRDAGRHRAWLAFGLRGHAGEIGKADDHRHRAAIRLDMLGGGERGRGRVGGEGAAQHDTLGMDRPLALG